MKHETPDGYIVALYLSDLLVTALSLALAQYLRERLPYGQPFIVVGGGWNLAIYLMALVIWTVTFRQLSAYDPDRILRFGNEVQTVWAAVGVSTLLLSGALYLSYRGVSRLLFLYFAILDGVLTIVLRLLLRFLFKVTRGQRISVRRILLVGAGDLGCRMATLLDDRQWMGLQVVGFIDDDPEKLGRFTNGLPVLGTLDEARALVRQYRIDEVIITLPPYAYRRLEELVTMLNNMPANVRVVPGFFPLAYLRTSVGMLGDVPLITLKEPVLTGPALLAKRALDVALAVIALLVLWPSLLLIAIWIKLDSPGPVLFRQQRVGWHGELFTMYKFRTMAAGAEYDEDRFIAKTQDGRLFLRKDGQDPRVTILGRHLRRWSLDELPQLFNVLKGEMSLVGPRPELPSVVEAYEPWEYKRLSVPPGMTGWWQITGRSAKEPSLRAEDDIYYARNYSFLLDLQILLRTIGAVIRGEGAY